MFGHVKLALASALMLGVFCVAGCGDGSSSSTAAEGHSGQTGGHTGGMHALGENPEATSARLKKAGGSAKSQPQRLPGR